MKKTVVASAFVALLLTGVVLVVLALPETLRPLPESRPTVNEPLSLAGSSKEIPLLPALDDAPEAPEDYLLSKVAVAEEETGTPADSLLEGNGIIEGTVRGWRGQVVSSFEVWA